jgi:hypothetical protein
VTTLLEVPRLDCELEDSDETSRDREAIELEDTGNTVLSSDNRRFFAFSLTSNSFLPFSHSTLASDLASSSSSTKRNVSGSPYWSFI